MAALLYHSTPWLHTTWKSDDVLFFNFDEPNTLDSPHLHHLSRREDQNSTPFLKSTRPKNELIYQLGVMLLELEFEDTLPSLVEKSTLEGNLSVDMLSTDPLILLKHRAGEQLGSIYGRMVWMCLDCDFGLGLNNYPLEDPHVQKVFYSRIVRQFQERMPEYGRIWED